MRIDLNKLISIRKKRGLTLVEASERMGLPMTVLKRWETGKLESPFESGRDNYAASAILRVYDIRVEDLYYDCDIERLNKTFDILDIDMPPSE